MRIDRHLTRRGGSYDLRFEGHETKTGHPLESPLPNWLTPYLQHDLNHIRPVWIGDQNSDRLWFTRDGIPMRDKAIHRAFTVMTRRWFGEPINPHMFRDCAVTFVAVNDPTHIGIAPHVLGHIDMRTTEAHYIQANQLVASRRWRRSVDTLRKTMPEPSYERQGRSRRR